MARKTPNVGYIRPEAQDMIPDWELVNDCVTGQRRIKEQGEQYLPKILASRDVSENDEINAKYLQRAVFYPVTGRTLEELVGEVFLKPMDADLPSGLVVMEDDVDGGGVSLEQQAKGVLSDVLKHGRAGLLVDFPVIEPGEVVTKADLESGEFRPKIIQYTAAQVINWTVGVDKKTGNTWLARVVLRELADISEDEFEKKVEVRWRVYRREQIQLEGQEDPVWGVTVEVWRETDASQRDTTNDETEYEIAEAKRVILQYDQRPLPFIPFQFIGSENNDPEIDHPPLLDLANLNISHYQNSADVHWSAFMEGQTTVVISGLTEPWADKYMEDGIFFGGGNALLLPEGGKADLLQASPTTMASELMRHKEDQMKAVGARLVEPDGSKVEKTKFEVGMDKIGQVSILSKVANNVASAYEAAFTFAEAFLAEPTGETEISLNTEYDFGGIPLPELMDGYFKGVLSFEEVRHNARRKGALLDEDQIARASLAGDNPNQE